MQSESKSNKQSERLKRRKNYRQARSKETTLMRFSDCTLTIKQYEL